MNNFNVIALDFVKEEKENYNKVQMDEIMKKLFHMNKRAIIDFLNAIYKDNISYNAKIEYENKEITIPKQNMYLYLSHYADMYLKVIDDEQIYEYELEFQTLFDNNMAIRLFRYGFEKAVLDYPNSQVKGVININLPEPFLIVLEEESDVPDEVILNINIPKQGGFTYKSKVLKYWNYDLEMLYNEGMYMLYPLQIFKMRKSIDRLHKSRKSDGEKQKDINKIFIDMENLTRDTLIKIDDIYDSKKISLEDYDNMTTVIENLWSYFLAKYGNYKVIQEVKDMVKSFYDPKVEERGIEKGIEKGEFKRALETAREMLADGEPIEKIVKYSKLSLEKIEELRKQINSEG